MAVDPQGQDLKRYLAEDPGGPVVMLNLLRFRPDGGRERYLEYVAHFRRTAAPFGAEAQPPVIGFVRWTCPGLVDTRVKLPMLRVRADARTLGG